MSAKLTQRWNSAGERRQKVLWIDGDDIVSTFNGLREGDTITYPVLKGLPADARVVSVNADWQRGLIGLLVESAEFDAVPPGEMIPNFQGEWGIDREATCVRDVPGIQLRRMNLKEGDTVILGFPRNSLAHHVQSMVRYGQELEQRHKCTVVVMADDHYFTHVEKIEREAQERCEREERARASLLSQLAAARVENVRLKEQNAMLRGRDGQTQAPSESFRAQQFIDPPTSLDRELAKQAMALSKERTTWLEMFPLLQGTPTDPRFKRWLDRGVMLARKEGISPSQIQVHIGEECAEALVESREIQAYMEGGPDQVSMLQDPDAYLHPCKLPKMLYGQRVVIEPRGFGWPKLQVEKTLKQMDQEPVRIVTSGDVQQGRFTIKGHDLSGAWIKCECGHLFYAAAADYPDGAQIVCPKCERNSCDAIADKIEQAIIGDVLKNAEAEGVIERKPWAWEPQPEEMNTEGMARLGLDVARQRTEAALKALESVPPCAGCEPRPSPELIAAAATMNLCCYGCHKLVNGQPADWVYVGEVAGKPDFAALCAGCAPKKLCLVSDVQVIAMNDAPMPDAATLLAKIAAAGGLPRSAPEPENKYAAACAKVKAKLEAKKAAGTFELAPLVAMVAGPDVVFDEAQPVDKDGNVTVYDWQKTGEQPGPKKGRMHVGFDPAAPGEERTAGIAVDMNRGVIGRVGNFKSDGTAELTLNEEGQRLLGCASMNIKVGQPYRDAPVVDQNGDQVKLCGVPLVHLPERLIGIPSNYGVSPLRTLYQEFRALEIDAKRPW